MALKPKINVAAPVEEVIDDTSAQVNKGAKVVAVLHKQRHPITGVMFNPGVPVDVLDLDDEENAFVRHQIEAGVFKIL